MKLKSIPHLVGFIVLSQLAGVIGSVFTFQSVTGWYTTLARPWFTPPNWLFGPAWVTLYFLMGVAAYLVWEKGWEKKEVKTALYWFGFQLALNALWSILFFGLQSPLYGLVGIVVLWLSIAMTIKKFNCVSKKAAWLLVPYILWVSFATLLNFSIWTLNT